MKPTQLTLPLSRCERRDIIRDVSLSTFGPQGKRASGKVQKALLRDLTEYAEKYGHCFPSLETLGRCCSCCKKTVQNGLDALEAQELIVRTPRDRTNRRGATTNAYAIVWTDLAAMANRTLPTSKPIVERIETVTDQVAVVATCSDQVATSTDQVATVADQVALATDQVATVATHEKRRENKREKIEGWNPDSNQMNTVFTNALPFAVNAFRTLRPNKNQDRKLLATAAMLSVTSLSECWLNVSIGGVTRAGQKTDQLFAKFLTCCRDHATRLHGATSTRLQSRFVFRERSTKTSTPN